MSPAKTNARKASETDNSSKAAKKSKQEVEKVRWG